MHHGVARSRGAKHKIVFFKGDKSQGRGMGSKLVSEGGVQYFHNDSPLTESSFSILAGGSVSGNLTQ